MKTLKVFLMLAFLSLITAGTASSQTKQTKEEWDGFFYNQCTNEEVIGTITIHYVNHFNKAGVVDWMKTQAQSGELVGVISGEIFKFSYAYKESIAELGSTSTITNHYNLVGSKGSHVLYSVTYQIDASGYWTIVSEKSKCL